MLPATEDVNMTWKPIPGQIMTRWANHVTPENAWLEYPRPQLRRNDWMNLNGLWNFEITKREFESTTGIIRADPLNGLQESSNLSGEILVPYPIESALSGVKHRLLPNERLSYRRYFSIPPAWKKGRVLLHFGAVDWETKVFVNGRLVGEHTGGYLPFYFDISSALIDGKNELEVSVWDPTDTYWQQRGKQVLEPKTIWYTAVSGIWQTVWLEPVPLTYIASLKTTPDIDEGCIRVKVKLAGSRIDGEAVRVLVMDGEVVKAARESDSPELAINIPFSDVKLWSPDSPFLYELEVRAGEDKVDSYFGMRKFSLKEGRLCLNNTPYFQFGPLDQGYWPDGLYTPPSDAAMQADIKLVKDLGCNMLRKHVKVEPARFYYYCDRMGLIVWQDFPNGGANADEIRLFLENLVKIPHNDRNFNRSGRQNANSRADFRRELQEMVDHLYNFTCIGMWVPFNEAWGQFEAKNTAEWLMDYDPTRTVDHASGWFDQGGGDCDSQHIYFRKLKLKRKKDRRAMILSEFGGYNLKISGHLWDPSAEFGFKKFYNPEVLTEAYITLINNELSPSMDAGLSAAVYTQTTDVEIEVNGYVTYDREVEKMNFCRVRKAHHGLWQ